MTLFTIFLIAVIILAVIGLGWQTFTLAILDGFDKTLDVGLPIIKNLASETQEANAQAQLDKESLYEGLNTNFRSDIQFQIAACGDKIKQYDDLSSGLKSAPLGQNLYNDILACDHNALFLKGVCEAVGVSEPDSFCPTVDGWINSRGLQNEPRPDTYLGAEAFSN